jgi:hypothetical protein
MSPEEQAAIALMDFTFEALGKPPRESEEEHEDRTEDTQSEM